jgi:hypothetical protein
MANRYDIKHSVKVRALVGDRSLRHPLPITLREGSDSSHVVMFQRAEDAGREVAIADLRAGIENLGAGLSSVTVPATIGDGSIGMPLPVELRPGSDSSRIVIVHDSGEVGREVAVAALLEGIGMVTPVGEIARRVADLAAAA